MKWKRSGRERNTGKSLKHRENAAELLKVTDKKDKVIAVASTVFLRPHDVTYHNPSSEFNRSRFYCRLLFLSRLCFFVFRLQSYLYPRRDFFCCFGDCHTCDRITHRLDIVHSFS